MFKNNKKPKRAQSAEAAEKVAAASKEPTTPAKKSDAPVDPKAPNAAKAPKSDHDQLEEIRDTHRKIAKVEAAIADLQATVKTRREALKTLQRELRYLLSGQAALPFGKAGKVETLDTTSAAKTDGVPDWFEVREIGSNRHVANHRVGDPALDDYRKKSRDFVVRPLSAPPPEAKATTPTTEVVDGKLAAKLGGLASFAENVNKATADSAAKPKKGPRAS